MAFSFPDGLAPEVYPLAWLVGRWQGRGEIAYPGIETRAIVNTVVFDHDGGPYLTYSSTVRVLDMPQGSGKADSADQAQRADQSATTEHAGDAGTQGDAGAQADVATEQGQVWSTESGYWTISTQEHDYLADGQQAVEVLLANPDGRLMFMDGVCGNGRIDLRSVKIVRSSTGADVSASKRMYGNVEGQLMWVEEIAAFGQPLGNYLSVALHRVEDA